MASDNAVAPEKLSFRSNSEAQRDRPRSDCLLASISRTKANWRLLTQAGYHDDKVLRLFGHVAGTQMDRVFHPPRDLSRGDLVALLACASIPGMFRASDLI